ncbi:hypothetical protein [Christensenella tenuis]|jgi:hypothetical protein|nr:hypothetical protein [Christensenella tenuis]
MANTMFERFGLPVHEFMNQRLDWFLRMRNATEAEKVWFIDEVG